MLWQINYVKGCKFINFDELGEEKAKFIQSGNGVESTGRVVIEYQVGRLFNQAYARTATIQAVTSGFFKAGIDSTNLYLLGKSDSAAVQTTKRWSEGLGEVNCAEEILEREDSPFHLSRATTPDPNSSRRSSRGTNNPSRWKKIQENNS
ncbi:hypothetical protein Trydic_g13029 [Trypoxylus dichotomus]